MKRGQYERGIILLKYHVRLVLGQFFITPVCVSLPLLLPLHFPYLNSKIKRRYSEDRVARETTDLNRSFGIDWISNSPRINHPLPPPDFILFKIVRKRLGKARGKFSRARFTTKIQRETRFWRERRFSTGNATVLQSNSIENDPNARRCGKTRKPTEFIIHGIAFCGRWPRPGGAGYSS